MNGFVIVKITEEFYKEFFPVELMNKPKDNNSARIIEYFLEHIGLDEWGLDWDEVLFRDNRLTFRKQYSYPEDFNQYSIILPMKTLCSKYHYHKFIIKADPGDNENKFKHIIHTGEIETIHYKSEIVWKKHYKGKSYFYLN